jgi:1-acyl-sn-glycerol-3-phosphate acyltransferase
MVVFPEGTVKREVNTLLKFRNGAFKVALESGVPVVPVTLVKDINYNNRHWPKPRIFTIVIHEPIKYEDIKNLKTNELADQIRAIMKQDLNWDGE